jgi:general secretion pathway protein A
MYERFYGLAERPFELTPNPRYLFLSPSHAEALTMLQYGITRRNGLSLLIGAAGTGKTTLVYAALEGQRPETAFSVFLTNPVLTRDEFIDFLSWGFGLSPEAGTSKSRFLLELSRSLAARQAAGWNIETSTDKLRSIILIGQPELAEKLNAPSMRQLKQRIALRCSLSELDLSGTAAYIGMRTQVAGGDASTIFGGLAVETIYRASGGIPRTISVICENALISGFALKQRPIGADIIDEVCIDLGIEVPTLAVGPTPAETPDEAPAPQRFSFF